MGFVTISDTIYHLCHTFYTFYYSFREVILYIYAIVPSKKPANAIYVMYILVFYVESNVWGIMNVFVDITYNYHALIISPLYFSHRL